MDEVYTDLFMSLQGLEYFFVIRQNDSLAQSLCAGIVVRSLVWLQLLSYILVSSGWYYN